MKPSKKQLMHPHREPCAICGESSTIWVTNNRNQIVATLCSPKCCNTWKDAEAARTRLMEAESRMTFPQPGTVRLSQGDVVTITGQSKARMNGQWRVSSVNGDQVTVER